MKQVLLFGLSQAPKFAPPDIASKGITPEILREKLEEDKRKCAEHGFDIDLRLFHPDTFHEHWDEIRDIMKSKKWDGYIIGFGIRGIPELSPIFEHIVKMGHETLPGTPLGFNSKPLDVSRTCLRMFGGGVKEWTIDY